MSDSSLYLVFSVPPPEVDASTFESFYAQHVGEILTVPGWAAGRRYAVSKRSGAQHFPYSYLALYRIVGDANEATDRLYKASETDQIYIPDWFDDVPWLTWTSPSRAESPDPLTAETLYMSLRSEERGVAPGDQYELSEVDVDEKLPRYRWADIAVGTAASLTTVDGSAANLSLECTGLGPVVLSDLET